MRGIIALQQRRDSTRECPGRKRGATAATPTNAVIGLAILGLDQQDEVPTPCEVARRGQRGSSASADVRRGQPPALHAIPSCARRRDRHPNAAHSTRPASPALHPDHAACGVGVRGTQAARCVPSHARCVLHPPGSSDVFVCGGCCVCLHSSGAVARWWAPDTHSAVRPDTQLWVARDGAVPPGACQCEHVCVTRSILINQSPTPDKLTLSPSSPHHHSRRLQ